MRGPLLLVSILSGLAGDAQARAPTRSPVVVELFTAQGCTGCPQADKLLQTVGARPGVIALTLPVDYWDYLGWPDTLARPEFTARQRAYADRLKVREIYTPEIVVDGRRETSGSDADQVDRLIAEGRDDLQGGPRVQVLHGAHRVRISPGEKPAGRAEVWLVRFDPHEQSVRVKAGDNKGKLVSQRYVVRELKRLGPYSKGVRTFSLPAPSETGLSTLVLVQGAQGGRVLGAGQG